MLMSYTKRGTGHSNAFGLAPVWTRQGTVISALGGSSSSGDDGNVYEPTVLYDTNPQILAGYTNVFKMIYTGGWQHITLFYAESVDGVKWTRYGAILPGYARSCWIKVGDTYHLYASDGSLIYHFTSTNGITWSAPQAVIQPAQSWNNGGLHNMSIFIENGTWYMHIEGAAGQLSGYSMGVYTSTDGITWVHYAGNPVITGYNSGGPCVYKVGTRYYMWAHTTPSTAALPTDGSRFVSDDLFNWTLDVRYILQRRTVDEGPGAGNGQIADMNLIPFNGQVYMYYVGSGDGMNYTGSMHIKLATFPGSFADLVASQEGDGL
jgi:hypothetical protein